MLSTMSHLGPFELGQIKAHLYHGLSGAEIARILKKPDGKSEWKKQAIYNAIDKLAEILHGGGGGRKAEPPMRRRHPPRAACASVPPRRERAMVRSAHRTCLLLTVHRLESCTCHSQRGV